MCVPFLPPHLYILLSLLDLSFVFLVLQVLGLCFGVTFCEVIVRRYFMDVSLPYIFWFDSISSSIAIKSYLPYISLRVVSELWCIACNFVYCHVFSGVYAFHFKM